MVSSKKHFYDDTFYYSGRRGFEILKIYYFYNFSIYFIVLYVGQFIWEIPKLTANIAQNKLLIECDDLCNLAFEFLYDPTE